MAWAMIQMPKPAIPAEINNESALFICVPFNVACGQSLSMLITTIAACNRELPPDNPFQALSRCSAARLRNAMRRDVSSTITPDCTSCVMVRDTVSIVSPR